MVKRFSRHPFLVLGFAPLLAGIPQLAAQSPANLPEAAAAASAWTQDPRWGEVQAAIAATPRVRASFVEERTLALRKRPVALQGTLRYDRERGLCLAYTEPAARSVAIDARGLWLREPGAEARARDLPEVAREVPRALLEAFTLEPAALARRFEVAGRWGEAGWELELRPRDEVLRRAVKLIRLRGVGRIVDQITLVQGPTSRIEISLREHAFPAQWQPAEAADFRPLP